MSYKPLLITESIIVDRDSVYITGSLKNLERISDELNAKFIYLKDPVLPGFIDTHLHIDSLGFELESIDLTDVKNRDQLLKIIEDLKPNVGEWIVCGRVDHLQFPDQRMPTRSELDSVMSKHPVLIIHRSGHMGVLNTKGLEIALKWIRDRQYIDYDKGWIYETPLWIVRGKIFENIDLNHRSRIMIKTDDYLRKHGITAVGVAGCSEKCLETLVNIDSYLKTRVYVYLYVENNVDKLIEKIVFVNSRLRRVKINGFKIILDGALGPRTAYLSSDYNDQPGNRGILLYNRDLLEKIIEKVNNYSLQTAIHAIGDASLDIVLEVYRKYSDRTFLMRNRIEHASLVRDDQMELIKSIKPIVVVQPHFIITDKWVLDRIGYERLNWLYRYRSLFESTITSFSTDSPVEPVNPWRTIYAAITRGEEYGLIHGKLTSSEKMNLIDSLHAYTRNSAIALRDDRLGCLYPGCYPDMITVSRNPLEITDPSELLEIESKPVDLD